MSLSKQEQETIITYNEAEATANVYTHNRALRRRLEALANERPENCRLSRTFPSGAVEYTVPKQWVKLTPPRQMSAEQREAMRERGRKWASERWSKDNSPCETT
ncbi:MAG: hypothetical protein LIO95_06860 [Clostridiales bacterium]|nr:hypothetical protein [Clostridiales bacterium]